jgi:hypothetical protein
MRLYARQTQRKQLLQNISSGACLDLQISQAFFRLVSAHRSSEMDDAGTEIRASTMPF